MKTSFISYAQPGYHWKEDILHFPMACKSFERNLIETSLFPEQSQIQLSCVFHDIGNCLVLSLVRPVRLSNLPGINWRNARFSAESPFRKPAKTSENSKQNFPLFSFLAIMTLGCNHVFCPHGRMESPE